MLAKVLLCLAGAGAAHLRKSRTDSADGAGLESGGGRDSRRLDGHFYGDFV